MTNIKNIVSNILLITELGKVKITFFVALSTLCGIVFASGDITVNGILISIGVFILACGSAAFNHIQEIPFDALMERTNHRPLPEKRISINMALLTASILSLSGLFIIYANSGYLPAGLGLFSLVWYNLLYTPLKRKTAWAVIPGALVGAVPPAIGWTSAGGELFDFQLIQLAGFFFIWQLPHFWFLMIVYSDQYKKAGYPVLTDHFKKSTLFDISFIMTALLALICVSIPIFGTGYHIYTKTMLIVFSIVILTRLFIIRKPGIDNLIGGKKIFVFAFRDVNLFVLTALTILTIDKLLSH